jgi:flagellum-specific peptidoglycan hydrolase FlgJ
MQRIQYRPSARTRGFNPQQLSTAGIDRMREESNRVIRGMERRDRAETAQREREEQAMREDQAYTDRITRENQAIEMQNLKNTEGQGLALAQQAVKQGEQDKRDFDSAMSSLASISRFAKAYIDKQEAEKVKEAGKYTGEAPDPDDVINYNKGLKAQTKGALRLNTEITVNGVLQNEDRLETLKGYVANHGMTGRAGRNIDNAKAFQSYNHVLTRYQQGTEKEFTAADGTKYSGVESLSNPYLAADLAFQTKQQIVNYFGGDAKHLSDAIQKMDAAAEVGGRNARANAINQNLQAIEQTAVDLESSGKADDILMAFHLRKDAKGAAAAHEAFQKLIANPDSDVELLGSIDLTGSGKGYAAEWEKSRWLPALQQRQDAVVRRAERDERLKKAEDREWVNANIDSIRAAYEQDPRQAQALVLERYHSKNMTVPPAIAAIERSALKKNKDLVVHTVNERAKYGILDLPFINSIEDPTVQKQARELYTQQEEAKYGPEALGIKKGFKATARSLTKINPNEEQGNAQTFLVQARLESEYLKQVRLTNDPLKALENVNKMVDLGRNGDKSSPFYQDTGFLNNRLVFPNIESSDVERQEKNNYIDNQILKHGRGAVDKPFVLADSNEMDAAYASSTTGSMKYPPGILRFAESTGLAPSEVFNAHRMANNTATGDNKPLIAPTPASIMVDAASPEMRKLFLSGEPSMIKRAGAQMSGDLGFTRQERKTIDSFVGMAGAAGAKFPELVAAQMILESAGGTALSGTNNFFGMKATASESSTAKQTTEFRDGVEGTETANFKNYSSPQESVSDLVNKWYKDYSGYQGVNNANSLEEAAMMLQQQGYATDPEYAQKLIQIANRFR